MREIPRPLIMSKVSNHKRREINEQKYRAGVSCNPLHEVTLTSFGLGIVAGLLIGSIRTITLKNLNAYVAFICLFHFLEYYITAKFNPWKVNRDSFLLNNGSAYILCHLMATLECLLEYIFFPKLILGGSSRIRSMLITSGYICIIVGQTIRSLAMATAGRSFSHMLQTEKKTDHELIQDGVYQWARHPSYFGFFWWALGTQMILLNPISFLLFTAILWNFFRQRIKMEEEYLIKFFGDDYIKFRNRVPVRIPFIH